MRETQHTNDGSDKEQQQQVRRERLCDVCTYYIKREPDSITRSLSTKKPKERLDWRQ
jgi:predicted metal-dependent peptidase